MIQLSGISAGYGDKEVIHGLTLSLPEEGAVALMAPSGYGKTTLLRVLAGLNPLWAGSITGWENRKISFLFQEDRLLPWCSALQNVALVSDEKKARQWLADMEIENPALLPREMSGGMQRRVALARAMAFGGDALLLDEPFKGLDEALRARVASRIRGRFPLTVLSVHDGAEAEMMGAQIVRLERFNQPSGGGI